MVTTNTLTQEQNITGKKQKRFNMTNLYLHAIRLQGAKGFTAVELFDHLTNEGIEVSYSGLAAALTLLSGCNKRYPEYDILKCKQLKKDKRKSGRGILTPKRYYYNKAGTHRSRGMFGQVTKHNVKPATTLKVCRLTGKPATQNFVV